MAWRHKDYVVLREKTLAEKREDFVVGVIAVAYAFAMWGMIGLQLWTFVTAARGK